MRCIIEDDIEYPGEQLNPDAAYNKDRRDTPDKCRILCTSDPRCEFFTWKESRVCWLLSEIDRNRKRPMKGAVSGAVCRNLEPGNVQFDFSSHVH